MKVKDTFKTSGYVDVYVTKGRPSILNQGPSKSYFGNTKHFQGETVVDCSGVDLIEKLSFKNIIVDKARDRMLDALELGPMRVIGRMAIGDRGTIPSDSTVPKIPTGERSALYNEVYRTDIDVVSTTKTPTVGAIPGVYKIQFTTTFSALSVPLASMSNQTNPVVNEVGLMMVDPIGGNPLPRGPVSAPNPNDADEEMFAMRAFKSVPFDQANELQITIRYTIAFE